MAPVLTISLIPKLRIRSMNESTCWVSATIWTMMESIAMSIIFASNIWAICWISIRVDLVAWTFRMASSVETMFS